MVFNTGSKEVGNNWFDLSFEAPLISGTYWRRRVIGSKQSSGSLTWIRSVKKNQLNKFQLNKSVSTLSAVVLGKRTVKILPPLVRDVKETYVNKYNYTESFLKAGLCHPPPPPLLLLSTLRILEYSVSGCDNCEHSLEMEVGVPRSFDLGL